MATSTKDSVPEDIKNQEGSALRKILDNLKINHQRLARDADVGTKAYISQLVNGRRPLNIEAAARIAGALGVQIDAFSPRLAAIVRSAHEHVSQAAPIARIKSCEASEPTPSCPGDESGYVTPHKPPSSWPFATLTPSQYWEISEGGREELEQIARGMYIEAHRSAKVSAG